jgi:hypothetical protein
MGAPFYLAESAMGYIDPRYLEHQRKRFTRNNAQLYIRHDAWRFAPPDSPRYSGEDVVRYCEPQAESDRRSQAAAADKAAQTAAEFEAAEGERLAFRHELAKLRRDWELFKFALKGLKAFNPDQPRVPAGSPDGGQWTDEGAAGAPGTRYAQGGGQSGYPIDLQEEERLGGHPISAHVGKSEAYLKERVRQEAAMIVDRGDHFRGLGVGSFTSLESANRLVNSTIAQNQTIVDEVARGEQGRAFLSSRFSSRTGYEAYLSTYHSQPFMQDTYGVGVVILRDPRAEKGFRAQTAFPLR